MLSPNKPSVVMSNDYRYWIGYQSQEYQRCLAPKNLEMGLESKYISHQRKIQVEFELKVWDLVTLGLFLS
jgi:hypothetical protein